MAKKIAKKPRPRRAGGRAAPSEPTLWAALEPTAKAAFAFWNAFIGLRMGSANDKPLDNGAISQWLCIIRAVSWVESRHGTGSGNHPAEDPMQDGNPADTWWRELTDQIPRGQQDRFVCGPGKPNFYAGELPDAAAAEAAFPNGAKLSSLNDETDGHNDPKFNTLTSIYWAIPFLLHKANKPVDGATFKCGDCSRARLVDGAVAYNGNGVPDYREQINKALDMIGCMSDLVVEPMLEMPVEGVTADVFVEILKALREQGQSAEGRILFPNGINLLQVEVKVGSAVVLSVKVSGAATSS